MLRYDAIGPLLEANDPALAWAVGHDILDEPLPPEALWELSEVAHIVRRQTGRGSWPYPAVGAHIRSHEDYAQLATYQQMRTLVCKYRLDRRHPAVPRAADFLLEHQAAQGDIRGIYGSQYTPNYTADMLSLLIAAGYQDDSRILRGLEWLLAMRQDDGGWAIPVRTAPPRSGGFSQVMALPEPIEPVRSRPSSHFVTGIVLRALAAHPRYRSRRDARLAADLLASRFFKADRYADRADAGYWTKLAYPFRWTDILSSLDAIALIQPDHRHVDVAGGLEWLAEHQRPSGLWSSGYPKTRDPLVNHWVTFAVARVFKRFYGMQALIHTEAPRRARPAPRRAPAGRPSAA